MSKTYKIFTTDQIYDFWFSKSIPGISFVKSQDKADICFLQSTWEDGAECFVQHDENIIYHLPPIPHPCKKIETLYNLPSIQTPLFKPELGLGKYVRKDIRNGYCVDDKIRLPPVKNFCFSWNDLCKDPYIISTPLGFNNEVSISQPKQYWSNLETIQNNKYHNRVYWKGNVANHQNRKMILEYYENNKDSRFDVSPTEHRGIYHNPCSSNIYQEYINNLSTSDMCFGLRGDRPTIHSFFDLLQCGCIPILINCMDYGWENIMSNVGDYMLQFDLNEHSMDEIHNKIIEVLEDKERILTMKHNCINLFESFFKFQKRSAWGDFLLAKCIEIHKNDFDLQKIDNKFISSEFLNFKGLTSKL